MRQGEGGIGLYFITSGEVEVMQERGGREQHLRTMAAGEAFGELALLTDHPRTATVRATKPTDCLVLTAWNFRVLLDESPEVTKQLVKTLAQWLVEAEDRAASD